MAITYMYKCKFRQISGLYGYTCVKKPSGTLSIKEILHYLHTLSIRRVFPDINYICALYVHVMAFIKQFIDI